jgi:hypothetical protein
MSNQIKLLSIIIFLIAIWLVNSNLLPMLSADLESIDKLKKELLLKQAFNDNNPEKLYKSSNEFVLDKYDKNKLINLIDSFTQESGVNISSLSIELGDTKKSAPTSNVEDENLDTSEILGGAEKSNKLKIIDINIAISGNKSSVDSFLSKLADSKQYIDIQSVSGTTNLDVDGFSQKSNSSIRVKTYYVTL